MFLGFINLFTLLTDFLVLKIFFLIFRGRVMDRVKEIESSMREKHLHLADQEPNWWPLGLWIYAQPQSDNGGRAIFKFLKSLLWLSRTIKSCLEWLWELLYLHICCYCSFSNSCPLLSLIHFHHVHEQLNSQFCCLLRRCCCSYAILNIIILWCFQWFLFY